MAGLENEMAAGSGRGRLRASDADREHVIDALKAAYVYGLVTKDEFDARVSQTLASRTYAELALVTADIPAGLSAASPPLRPALAKVNPAAHAKVRPGDRAIVATATFAGPAFVASVFTSNPVAGSLVLGATGSAFVSLFLLGRQILRSRRDNRSGGHLPPRRAIHSGPRAGHRAASATSAEHPSTSNPRRRSSADAARRHRLRPQLSS